MKEKISSDVEWEERRSEDDRRSEDSFESYKTVLDLWSKENPIKTTKLQVLLAVNALLISGAGISNNGLTSDKWPVYVAGAVFSAVWTFSIGRTALFQEAWSRKLDDFATRFPDDERFQLHQTAIERAAAPRTLRTLGGVPSKWYLTFSPLAFTIIWILILVVTLASS